MKENLGSHLTHETGLRSKDEEGWVGVGVIRTTLPRETEDVRNKILPMDVPWTTGKPPSGLSVRPGQNLAPHVGVSMCRAGTVET